MTTSLDKFALKNPLSLIPFDHISPQDFQLIQHCANRAQKIVNEYNCARGYGSMHRETIDPEALQIAMDIAAVHVYHGIKLWQWYASSDLDFMSDVFLIAKNIDRSCGRLPNGVKLQFAESS